MYDTLPTIEGTRGDRTLDEEMDLQVMSWNVKLLEGEPFSTSLAANSQCRRGLELRLAKS